MDGRVRVEDAIGAGGSHATRSRVLSNRAAYATM
jgi:hypothetical protein